MPCFELQPEEKIGDVMFIVSRKQALEAATIPISEPGIVELGLIAENSRLKIYR